MDLSNPRRRYVALPFGAPPTSGVPVATAELVDELGMSEEVAVSALRELVTGGRIRVVANGDIVGSTGLGVVPAAIVFASRSDGFGPGALGILGALGVAGDVHSRDPLSGETIELSFAGGDPEPIRVVLFRAPDEGYLSKHDEYCPLINLFHDDAAAWASQNRER